MATEKTVSDSARQVAPSNSRGPAPRRNGQRSVVTDDDALRGTGEVGSDVEMITIPPLDVAAVTLTVIGESPVIVHAFGQKARQQMLDKQKQAARQKKSAKDPKSDFLESLYPMTSKKDVVIDTDADDRTTATSPYGFGLPAAAFKAAAVAACRYTEMKMTVARGAFHVMAVMNKSGDMLVPILRPDGTFAHAVMREDVVRLPTGVADIRHRGMFELPWKVELTLRYNRRAISIEQLANQYQNAGFGVGVCEWRPGSESGGTFGMFRVATDQ